VVGENRLQYLQSMGMLPFTNGLKDVYFLAGTEGLTLLNIRRILRWNARRSLWAESQIQSGGIEPEAERGGETASFKEAEQAPAA
jgi:hypothetical protein